MAVAIPTRHLYEAIWQALSQGERVVVATVVDARGSTPQRSGAKLVVFQDGRTMGTVGGGRVEAEVLLMAQEVLRQGPSGLFAFHLADEEEEGDVCGGTMSIFLDLWSP